jgi:iron complex transport system ATP-binding protein
MLEACGVSYAAGPKLLLAEVNLSARPGTVTVLIGPNGAGKSTLLRILSGELHPSAGDVRLDGKPLMTVPAGHLAQRRAVVPQASALAFPFTALEVAMLGATVPGFQLDDAQSRCAAENALGALGMSDVVDRPYAFLSGGEHQRVHIARALVQLTCAPPLKGTRVLLLDEPTSSLDLAHQAAVLDVMAKQASAQTAVVAVLHDLNLAAAVADELVLLAQGRVASRGKPERVLKDDILSAVYGCQVAVGRVPENGKPFLLPPALF